MATDHIIATDINTGVQFKLALSRISELIYYNCNVGKGYEVVLAGGSVLTISEKNYKEIKDFLDSKASMLEMEHRIRYFYTDD